MVAHKAQTGVMRYREQLNKRKKWLNICRVQNLLVWNCVLEVSVQSYWERSGHNIWREISKSCMFGESSEVRPPQDTRCFEEVRMVCGDRKYTGAQGPDWLNTRARMRAVSSGVCLACFSHMVWGLGSGSGVL